MIDIGLGVGIDPTDAKQGAKEATQAADKMARDMTADLEKVEQASKEAGQTVKTSGDKMERAAKDVGDEFTRLGRNRGAASFSTGVRGSFGGIAQLAVDALDSLGLLDNGFGRLVRRGESFARVGSQAQATFGGMAAGAQVATAATGGLMAALAPLLPALLAIGAAVAALVGGFLALKTAVGFIASGFPLAAQLEDATVSLAVLMGDFEGAGKRINEITDFAARTPFETPELIEASRILQVFTNGTLAASEGLTLIGDAAAGVGRPMSEVSMWVGRLYAALQGGQPIGEATMRLLEMGAITPQVKGQLDDMAATGNEGGKNFAKIWGLAEQSLERFAGTMSLRSGTWNGLLSTLRDNWGLMKAEMAAPIQDALKPVLVSLIEMIKQAKPQLKELGEYMAESAKTLIGLFKSDQIGEFTGAFLKGRMMAMVNEFQVAMGQALIWLTEKITEPVAVFAVDFHNVAVDFINSLLDGIDKVIDKMTAITKPLENTGVVDWLSKKMFPTENDATPWTVGAVGAGSGDPTRLDRLSVGAGQRAGETMASEIIDSLESVISDYSNADPMAEFRKLQETGLAEFEKHFGSAANSLNKAGDATATTAGHAETLTENLDAAALAAQNLVNASNGGAGDKRQGTMQGGTFISWADVYEGKVSRYISSPYKNHPAMVGQDGRTDLMANASYQAYAAERQAYEEAERWAQVDAAMMRNAERWDEMTYSSFTNTVTRDAAGTVAQIASQSASGTILEYLAQTGYSQVSPYAYSQAAGYAATEPAPERYHSGGTATSERPAILEAGETVLTAETAAEIRDRLRGGLSNAGAGSVTIINVTSPDEILEAVAANPDAIFNVISSQASRMKALIERA